MSLRDEILRRAARRATAAKSGTSAVLVALESTPVGRTVVVLEQAARASIIGEAVRRGERPERMSPFTARALAGLLPTTREVPSEE